MAVDIDITVEDVNTQLLTYTSIQLESAASVAGSYTLVDSEALVEGNLFYTLSDSAGTLNTWYRYRFYNATGPVVSEYSNPFRPEGMTRLKVRQDALVQYGAGLVAVAAAGGSTTAISSVDSNLYTAFLRAGRGVGSWINPTTGARAGQQSRVTASTPSVSATALTVSPAMTGALAAADEFEMGWIASPNEWNLAINRACARYFIVDRVPIVGDGTVDLSLAHIPWLRSVRQVGGLWMYPDYGTAAGISTMIPYADSGRWWGLRQEGATVYLRTTPALGADQTVYLEATRPVAPVFTDTSVLPNAVSLDMLSAIVWDEILANLVRPTSGAAVSDRALYEAEKRKHQSVLAQLWAANKPLYTPQARKTSAPAAVNIPWGG